MDDLSRFRAMVVEEPVFQSQLLAESELHRFIELVVRLSAERGLRVTPDAVRRALDDARAGAIDRYRV